MIIPLEPTNGITTSTRVFSLAIVTLFNPTGLVLPSVPAHRGLNVAI